MEKESFIKAIDNFKNKKIIVIGDILLDKFSWGEINRINPEQPAAPVVKIKKETYVLGGAANVASNLVSLGAKTILFGIIGEDHYQKKIKKLCGKNNIKLEYVRIKSRNILKQRIMAHGQQVTRIDYGEENIQKINEKTQKQILKKLENKLKKEKIDFIILSDYDKFLFSEKFGKKLIALSKKYSIRTLADPKPHNIPFFKGCTLISPNKSEAEKITGIKYQKNENTLRKMGEKLKNKVSSEFIVITCGEDGMFSYHNEKYNFVKTIAKEVSNPTGAGDTFAAALTLALASGLDVHNSAIIANHAAGIVVEKVGTATPTIKELRESFLEK